MGFSFCSSLVQTGARYKKLKKRPALSRIDVVLNPCGLAILTHQHILIMLNAH
jgi:hypothetical protein